jgi:hypothetical protein
MEKEIIDRQVTRNDIPIIFDQLFVKEDQWVLDKLIETLDGPTHPLLNSSGYINKVRHIRRVARERKFTLSQIETLLDTVEQYRTKFTDNNNSEAERVKIGAWSNEKIRQIKKRFADISTPKPKENDVDVLLASPKTKQVKSGVVKLLSGFNRNVGKDYIEFIFKELPGFNREEGIPDNYFQRMCYLKKLLTDNNFTLDMFQQLLKDVVKKYHLTMNNNTTEEQFSEALSKITKQVSNKYNEKKNIRATTRREIIEAQRITEQPAIVNPKTQVESEQKKRDEFVEEQLDDILDIPIDELF